MGSAQCCIAFNINNDDNEELVFDKREYFYMAQLLNTSVLEGSDLIQFFDGGFPNLVVNVGVS